VGEARLEPLAIGDVPDHGEDRRLALEAQGQRGQLGNDRLAVAAEQAHLTEWEGLGRAFRERADVLDHHRVVVGVNRLEQERSHEIGRVLVSEEVEHPPVREDEAPAAVHGHGVRAVLDQGPEARLRSAQDLGGLAALGHVLLVASDRRGVAGRVALRPPPGAHPPQTAVSMLHPVLRVEDGGQPLEVRHQLELDALPVPLVDS